MDGRTRGPGSRNGERRAEICDAVLNVVDDAGLAAVSLTSVAARAGVSAGRVQHYFPTRDALVEAAFARANERAAERITALTGPDGGSGPRAVLEVVLTELVPHDRASRTHLRIRQSFTAHALADERIAASLRVRYRDLIETLANLVDAASPSVDGRDAAAHAVQLLALAEGLAYHVLLGVHPAATARRQVLDAVAAVLDGEA